MPWMQKDLMSLRGECGVSAPHAGARRWRHGMARGIKGKGNDGIPRVARTDRGAAPYWAKTECRFIARLRGV